MKRPLFIVLLMLAAFFSKAQNSKYFNKDGIAINGYDPVAFFLENKAIKGNDLYTTSWEGVAWKFSSQENLNLFKSSPEKYAPQYGGYCAYGCSEKHKSPTDQNTFTIIDNKLYFNYSFKVKEFWLKDTVNRIKLANIYWEESSKN